MSEPLAVVLLGPESARKRDESVQERGGGVGGRGKSNKQTGITKKCHATANIWLKWHSFSIAPRLSRLP